MCFDFTYEFGISFSYFNKDNLSWIGHLSYVLKLILVNHKPYFILSKSSSAAMRKSIGYANLLNFHRTHKKL